jgi:iron complex transport system substrate-binding protein
MESIISADPEVIFISSMGDENDVREYMDGVLSGDDWQTVSAVKDGECHYLPKEYSQFKPNANWYNAYLMLWEILYA